MKLFCLILLTVLVFACGNEKEINKKAQISDTHRLIPLDSLKIFFYNFKKNSIDSLSQGLTQQIVTQKGINFAKAFESLSLKDTNGYVYYQQYAYKLGMEGKPKEALEYINLGSNYTKNKGRYFFDKALIWGFIEPLGHRDSLYCCMDKAISYDSSNVYYYFMRSKFYNEDTLNNRALKDIEKAILLNPKDSALVNFRGEIKIALKDYKNAFEDLKYLSSENKSVLLVRVNKAYCLTQLNKIKESLKEIEDIIKIDPAYAKAYAVRAIAKEKSGDHEGAINDLEKGASLGDKECIDYMNKYNEYQKTNKSG